MARVKCPECGSEFVVPDQLVREPVMCPECGKNAVPVQQDKRPEAAPPKPGENEKDLFDALYEAADYEAKVSSPDAFGVADTRREPTPIQGPAAKRATVTPVGHPAGLKLQEIPEEKPRGKGGIIVLVIVLVGVLVGVTYFSWKFFQKGGAKEGVTASSPSRQTGQWTAGGDGLPWTPPMPDALSRIATQFAMRPEAVLEVNIEQTASDLFSIPATLPAIRAADFSQVAIRDRSGASVKAADLPGALQSALVESLKTRLSERALAAYAEASPTQEGYRLRVTVRLNPAWGVVPEGMATSSVPQGTELPCAAGILVSSAEAVAGDYAMPLFAGTVQFMPKSFRIGASIPTNAVIQFTPGQIVQVAGTVSYGDLDIASPARDAAAWLAGYVYSPDRDWNLIWVQEGAPVENVETAFRSVFALAGSGFVADVVKADPKRLGASSESALVNVLSDPAVPAEWLRPFQDCSDPYGRAATETLARQEEADPAAKLADTLRGAEASQALAGLPALSPGELVDLCRRLANVDVPNPMDVYAALTRRYVIDERMGDVRIQPEIKGMRITPVSADQRVADFMRAKLIEADPKGAGAVFQEMLALPRSWARLSAIQGILDTDHVDAGEWLRDLNKQLPESPALGPVAMREIEILRPNITRISRYDLKMVALQNLLRPGQLDKAEALVAEIVREQPGTDVARRAQQLLDNARASSPAP
jgi:hypothetical protein